MNSAEGNTSVRQWSSAMVSPGSKARARPHRGSSGTWEIPSSPFQPAGWETPEEQRPGPRAARPCPTGANKERSNGTQGPREGNEASREGRQDVGVPRSTGEAGEPTQGTPWREGGTGSWNYWRERWRSEPPPVGSPALCVNHAARLTHPLIFALQDCKDLSGDLMFREDLPEGGHERSEPRLSQGREELIPALPLGEERVNSLLRGAGVETLVQARALRRGAQQGQQGLGQRRQSQHPVAAAAVPEAHQGQPQPEARVLRVAYVQPGPEPGGHPARRLRRARRGGPPGWVRATSGRARAAT
ncbi:MAG: hypothetical protein JWM10_3162 [Myxococcaceae bacterium]|nr:hypothetical protein [Myxococcaceae bacterium]